MKISWGKLLLIVIVTFFIVFAIINVNQEKDDNKEILKNVTYVTDGLVKSENENKLVLVTGKIDYDNLVTFTELKEGFGTIKINRTVEDYVKVEDEDSKEVSYEWKEREVPLNSWDHNYLKEIVSAEKVSNIKVGEYVLDEKGKNLVPASKYYTDQERIGDLITTGIYYSRDPYEEDLKEGDIRITYKYYDLEKNPYLSILAVQKNNSFIPYESKKDNKIYKLFVGEVNTKEKLEKELKKGVKNTIRGKAFFIIIILGIGIFLIVDNKKSNKSNTETHEGA